MDYDIIEKLKLERDRLFRDGISLFENEANINTKEVAELDNQIREMSLQWGATRAKLPVRKYFHSKPVLKF